ncbi:anti-sigma factor [Actinacidiphila paucisporea]|uniref:Regulator of SigK n=1 Tax=Actinacidiphila paucisporea TaxID=310782 RepID=A0A1M7NMK1_9ACTN|nr:anti-sigma factor [Actinacidiphila paucisporea]SHN05127.1 Anti-sigma-K factor rskA [Actinacidiphila paucisporea]
MNTDDLHTDDLHTLTGAYALGALSDTESGAFARHMARCRACAQEVQELRETAARLALAVAEAPPARMRVRVMAALPEVRQLPPLTSGDPQCYGYPDPFDAPGPAQGGPDPFRPSGRAGPPPARPVLVAPRRRYQLPALVAAACLAAAVASGVAVDARHQADVARDHAARAEQQATAVTAVASAPDATFHTRPLVGGGTATVVASAQLGKAAVLYHDLPRLPNDRVYQLWFSRGGTMVSAGLLASGPTGGSLLLEGSTTGADAVGVTAEPHGGSRAPTGSPLALLPL